MLKNGLAWINQENIDIRNKKEFFVWLREIWSELHIHYGGLTFNKSKSAVDERLICAIQDKVVESRGQIEIYCEQNVNMVKKLVFTNEGRFGAWGIS